MNRPKLTGSRTQCAECGELFSSVSTFDRHRVGDFAGIGGTCTRRCLTVDELIAGEWPKNAKGFWLRPPPRAVHFGLGDAPAPPAATSLPPPDAGPPERGPCS